MVRPIVLRCHFLLTVVIVVLSHTVVASAESVQRFGTTGEVPNTGLRFNTGHQGSVTHLMTWSPKSLLVSAGTDGTLRVWDTNERKLIAAKELADGNAAGLVLHPSLPRAYVVVENGSKVNLVGWDWRRDITLFSVNLVEQPLYIGISRTAERLLLGRAFYDGLWILDAVTGNWQSDIRGGIVTFAATSTDDQNLLTYQPSGVLTYRSRATDEVQRVLGLPSELKDLALSSNRRYLIGRVGQSIVLLDAVTGVEVERRRVNGLKLMKTWPEANRILIVADGRYGPELQVFSIDADRSLSVVLTQRIFGTPTAIGFGEESIFLGLSDGTVLLLDLQLPKLEFSVFSRDNRLKLLDVAVTGDAIALGTELGAITIRANSVASDPFRLIVGEVAGFKANLFYSPFGLGMSSASRVTTLDASRVLVWSASGERGIAVLETNRTRLEPMQTLLNAPLENVDVTEGIVSIVDRAGQVGAFTVPADQFLNDTDDTPDGKVITVFEKLFSTKISGTSDVVASKHRGLQSVIAALSSFSAFGSSIINIMSSTGETVPVRDSRSFVYDLAFDPKSHVLYSIGIQSGEMPITSLKRHAGPDLDQVRTLFEIPGEDLGAEVVIDAVSGRVYFSLGGQVLVWDGQLIRRLSPTAHEARQLAVNGGRVYAVNLNGTLSIWSAITLELQFELHVWNDFEWVLTEPHRFWTSLDGARYLRN